MEIQEEFPNKFNCTYVRKHKTDQYTQETWEFIKRIKQLKRKIRVCKDIETQRGGKKKKNVSITLKNVNHTAMILLGFPPALCVSCF